MYRPLYISLSALTLLVAGGLLAVTCASCSNAKSEATTGSAAATAPATPARKGSAQLWSETCSRCHNLRSPSAYSADQWQVVMHDMRIRAQLTGQDQRQILEFLKSAH